MVAVVPNHITVVSKITVVVVVATGVVGVATLTTHTRTTSARSAVNSATLPSIAGSVLTRAIMALRRWRTRQQFLLLLIRHSAWYADSAATDHITGDLDKLSMKEHYGGQNQVHAANGSGMAIKHVGQSMVSTLSRSIILKMSYMFHNPHITLHQFIASQVTMMYSLNFTQFFFLIKDQFPKSVSISTTPLELIFSGVWGPAPTSIEKHNYFISFIDDFSKFS
jgi:hypothetical protein